jgi:hypothetical protein
MEFYRIKRKEKNKTGLLIKDKIAIPMPDKISILTPNNSSNILTMLSRISSQVKSSRQKPSIFDSRHLCKGRNKFWLILQVFLWVAGFEDFSLQDLFADHQEFHQQQHQNAHFAETLRAFGDFQTASSGFTDRMNVRNFESVFGGNPYSADRFSQRNLAHSQPDTGPDQGTH